MNHADLTVTVGGTALAAEHFAASTDVLRNAVGRPCAVMGHGLGATGGLTSFAENLAANGIDAVVIEPRGFGAGADHHAVIGAARKLAGVDPDRIVAWGVSLAGGQVLQVAAEDARVAAVVALTPVVTASSAMRVVVQQLGAVRAIRAAVELGGHRPVRSAKRLSCPVLVQVADQDRTAPPAAAMSAARAAGAEVRHYPCDHAGIHPGAEWHALAGRHQIDFLQRHLANPPSISGADA